MTPRGGSVPPAAHARLLRLGSAGVLLAIAAWHAGHAAWIEAKAQLAQAPDAARVARRTSAGAGDTRPWPWADTHPVARLLVPSRGVDTFVLAGRERAHARLRAGPPRRHARARARAATRSISGHRDTHFAFLRRLERGDLVVVEARDGRRRRFVVASTRVVDRQRPRGRGRRGRHAPDARDLLPVRRAPAGGAAALRRRRAGASTPSTSGRRARCREGRFLDAGDDVSRSA